MRYSTYDSLLYSLSKYLIISFRPIHKQEHMSRMWNVDGLGWNVHKTIPNNACLLHWTGEYKHWLVNGYHERSNDFCNYQQLSKVR